MRNPFDFFDSIYCINLDSRPDRYAQCIQEFTKMGIADRVERKSGVIYTGHTDRKRNACTGNHLAHAGCIVKSSMNKDKNCLIFEDDVEFFYDLETTYDILSKAIDTLSKDWGLLYFGINLDRWRAKRCGLHLARLGGGLSTHAYSINSNLFDLLIETNSNIDVIHNDVYYAENIIPKTEAYATIPLIAGQRTGYSDIMGQVISSNEMFKQRFRDGLDD